MKKNQNETATIQRRESVTFSYAIARKINTPLSLPIHQARCQFVAASITVSDPSDASSIPRPLKTPTS